MPPTPAPPAPRIGPRPWQRPKTPNTPLSTDLSSTPQRLTAESQRNPQSDSQDATRRRSAEVPRPNGKGGDTKRVGPKAVRTRSEAPHAGAYRTGRRPVSCADALPRSDVTSAEISKKDASKQDAKPGLAGQWSSQAPMERTLLVTKSAWSKSWRVLRLQKSGKLTALAFQLKGRWLSSPNVECHPPAT